MWRKAAAGILVGTVALISATVSPAGSVGPAGQRQDTNGDGRDELAIGIPLKDRGGNQDAGGSHVLYGSSGGVTGSGAQSFNLSTAGIAGEEEDFAFFAARIAFGDFNNDGYADLVVGAPGRTIGGVPFAGAVHVLYGSASGTTTVGAQAWNQTKPDVPGTAEIFDLFGASVEAGDFNGDGYDDLAIGSAAEAVNGNDGAGTVTILLGGASGLTATGAQLWHQDTAGVPEIAEPEEEFGFSLAAADFNNDTFDDLAIGSLDDPNGRSEAGAVNVLYGSAGALTSVGAQVFHQNSPDVPEMAESGDLFGASLAAGDFNADGNDDLAVGALGERVGTVNGAGAVIVLPGSGTGLTGTGSQLWNENSTGIPTAAASWEAFGTVAAGDFDGDGDADLSIGVPNENVGAASGAGMVFVLAGDPTGLSATGVQTWHQNIAGIPGAAEGAVGGSETDGFGAAVATGDFNGDTFADLAVGVPGEEVTSRTWDHGVVEVIYGTAAGLSATGAQIWHQNSPGLPGSIARDDFYGLVLMLGD